MNEGHLQRKLGLGWGIQLGLLFGGQLLIDGIGLELGLGWGLYKSQILGLRSPCIRSFSIIGVP